MVVGSFSTAKSRSDEENGMALDWDDMTDREKLEVLRGGMARVLATLNALMSDVDETWDAMRGTTSELGKIAKDVGTLKSLWPYPKKYSRTG
jgi:hypothetical protein